jgi:uncharacterized membrane protein
MKTSKKLGWVLALALIVTASTGCGQSAQRSDPAVAAHLEQERQAAADQLAAQERADLQQTIADDEKKLAELQQERKQVEEATRSIDKALSAPTVDPKQVAADRLQKLLDDAAAQGVKTK